MAADCGLFEYILANMDHPCGISENPCGISQNKIHILVFGMFDDCYRYLCMEHDHPSTPKSSPNNTQLAHTRDSQHHQQHTHPSHL